MMDHMDNDVIASIRRLYNANESAQRLFDWTAQRERDASATSIDLLTRRLTISRGEAVALARDLEAAGCGKFIVGRRGQKSRFEWGFSCISLGQAAAGESAKLEVVQAESEIDDEEGVNPDETNTSLTIGEAKARLALAFGVKPENIEITIKA
jgi:hypothetical protein